MNLLKRMIKLVGLLIVLALPLQAQRLDPDWCLGCKDSWQHFVAGSGIQVATLVVLPKSNLWQRLAINSTIQVAHEIGQESSARNAKLTGPGYGFGFKDLLFGIAGAVLTEKVNKWLFRS